MSTPNDGGSAFHEVFTSQPNERMGETHADVYSAGGMSLRDWFAGQALAGLCADHTTSGTPDNFATSAYDLADAMLKARSTPTPPKQA